LLIVFDNTLIITTDILSSFGDLPLVVIGNGIFIRRELKDAGRNKMGG
jgi:hypothetical protein